MTARILTGLTAVVLGLTASQLCAQRAAQSPSPAFDRASAASPAAARYDDRRGPADMTGEPASTTDAKSTAKQYLFQGRRALEQRDVARAAYYHHLAAELPATFGPNEDSPERLAADIRAFRQSAERSPAGPTGQQPPRGLVQLPPVDQATALPSPTGRRPVSPAGNFASGPAPRDGARPADPPAADPNMAYGVLLEARRALATGDTRRASTLARQARSTNAAFGTLDNPDKVSQAIAAYSDLMQQRAERGDSEAWRGRCARLLMEQADVMLRYRELDEAERLATAAAQQRARFSQFEPRPEALLDHIDQLRRSERTPARERSGVIPAAAEFAVPATGLGEFDRRAETAVYDPTNDRTRNVPAGAMLPSESQPTGYPPNPTAYGQPPMPSAAPPEGVGMALFHQGQMALKAGDSRAALDLFRQAAPYAQQMDPATARQLQTYLQMLPRQGQSPTATAMDEATTRQQMLFNQINTDVAQQISNSRKMRETDPKGAVTLLEQTRTRIETSELDSASRDRMSKRVQRELADTQQFIQRHRPQIEMEERNQKVREDIQRERQTEQELTGRFAAKVDECRQLIREHRFHEAEMMAKQAEQLQPDHPVAKLLVEETKIMRRVADNADVKEKKEKGFLDTLHSVELASVPFDDRNPITFPDAKNWTDLTARRQRYGKESHRRRSEREVEIYQKLKTPVSLQFENAPLSKVMDYLAKVAAVNLYLDPQGLSEEGISTDQPVTITLPQEVKLDSALNLILHPLRLTYVVKDEVLKITSEAHRAGDLSIATYSVADLVVPIPNFMPTHGMGLESALHGGFANVNGGVGSNPFGSSAATPMAVVASTNGRSASGMIDQNIMAQMSSSAAKSGVPMNMPMGMGQGGGAGGAAFADFESLINLITSTVHPTSWEDVGGPGSIKEFPTNLSLVVSQTQDVHEEIVDLLEQLRRMQDLQVTIEVRFITLNDNFFERIGVDFDFQINDNIDHTGMVWGRTTNTGTPGSNTSGTPPIRDTRPSIYREALGTDNTVAVGVSSNSPGSFTADLDIPFTQNSYGLAIPQFGGFDPTSAAQLGFAILSDVETYFFITAAQGDRRTNVLQAPKVTLFNGQMAFVSDTSQSPFVISVVPVVGDFAAAQQPVIVVLNEGTFMSVQAVVSADRRFVRLTVVPFFSNIGKVNTFQFQGDSTTTSDSSEEGVQDTKNDSSKKATKTTVHNSGTTVQLPTFSFVTVTTTVSVPDGGTVLLGGIKRLSEGRNEAGVPILNKIPYINRLFKNVGIGRETQSLMMMVTPRIIIQEEEEARLGITTPE